MKKELAIIQAQSLRGLLAKINDINAGEYPILKEDIVTVLRDEDAVSLLYYR